MYTISKGKYTEIHEKQKRDKYQNTYIYPQQQRLKKKHQILANTSKVKIHTNTDKLKYKLISKNQIHARIHWKCRNTGQSLQSSHMEALSCNG